MSNVPFSPRPDPFLGRVLKETYHLDRKVNESSTGTVYLGSHVRSDRPVAVKTMQGLREASSDICVRFFHEARILSKLYHPHVVDLQDFDFTPEGLPFLVMEYMEGCTLEAYVPPDGGLPLADAVRLMQQILEGVGAAHQAKLVHRDLCPANLFVADPSGTPTIKVLNFGVAKALNDSGAKTLSNNALGNPNYMSPEHFRNFDGMDARADIFSLGSVLYFMITGQDAFPNSTFPGVMAKVLSGQKPAAVNFEALGKPECAVLEPIIRRAMDPNPELRFASTEEMLEGLRAAVDGIGATRAVSHPGAARRVPRLRSVAAFAVGASPLLLLTGGFIGWQLLRSRVHEAPIAAAALPQPTRASDPAFRAFREALAQAVKSRDENALLSLVDPAASSGASAELHGAAAFQTAWHPEKADAPVWTALEALLQRPGNFPSADRFEIQSEPGSKAQLSALKSPDGAWRIDQFTPGE